MFPSDSSGHLATHSLVAGFQNGALAFASLQLMHTFETSAAGVSSWHARTHSWAFLSQNDLAVPYFISQLIQARSPYGISVHTGVSNGQLATHVFEDESHFGALSGHGVHVLWSLFQYGTRTPFISMESQDLQYSPSVRVSSGHSVTHFLAF